MRLQPSYQTMSDVPTGFEDAYSEENGKAVFSGGAFEFKTEADVLSMKKAKDHANTELSETKAKLKMFEGIDPEKHKAIVEEVDVLRAKVKNGTNDEETIKAIVDARVARATEELTKVKETLTGENAKLRETVSEFEKDSILGKVLREQVSQTALSDAEFIIGSAIERQADGTYMSNGSAGFEKGLSVEQLVAKAMESRPHWQKKNTPGHGGGGANGGNVITNTNRLQELVKKRISNDITRQEIAEMEKLAAEIKAEQQGNS